MNESLLQLKSVRISILLWAISILVVLISYGLDNSKYDFCLHFKCLVNFFQLIAILGPITAFFAGVITLLGLSHRTLQTSIQIEESKRGTNFDISIKHREEFIKHEKNSGNTIIKRNIDAANFHRKFFPYSRQGVLNLSKDLESQLIELSDELVELLFNLKKISHKDFCEKINQLFVIYFLEFGVYFSKKSSFDVHLKWKHGSETRKWSDTIKVAQSVICEIITLFEFELSIFEIMNIGKNVEKIMLLSVDELEKLPPNSKTIYIANENDIMNDELYSKLKEYLEQPKQHVAPV